MRWWAAELALIALLSSASSAHAQRGGAPHPESHDRLEQERRTERAHRAASLVQTHGKRAVIALAARGVGPHNAARIINKLREDEDEFYRDVLRQEREYARTQSFWD